VAYRCQARAAQLTRHRPPGDVPGRSGLAVAEHIAASLEVERADADAAAKATAVPTSRESAISSASSAEATPGLNNDRDRRPPTSSFTAPATRSWANGYTTVSPPANTAATRSVGGSRPSLSPS
jgi:hypothetical protein